MSKGQLDTVLNRSLDVVALWTDSSGKVSDVPNMPGKGLSQALEL